MPADNEKIEITPRPVCGRCVLPEAKPDIWLDSQGVCNICRAHEASTKRCGQATLLETEFVKILNQHKSRGAYDCLVMCSGGKDSTAALYYMKKRYKKRVLAFSFDHGFETGEALANVRNAVEALGVDYLVFKSDFMKEMFSDMVSSGSRAVICHPCSIWYMQLTFDLAARFEVPVIIAGWTRGQSSKQACVSEFNYSVDQQEFAAMARETQAFLEEYTKKNPKYKDFPRSMSEVIARANKKHKCLVLSPHWFLPLDSGQYTEIIKQELGWKPASESYPANSTNCSLNFLSAFLSLKHFGYTHYHVEMSKMIRQNLMTRDEALKLLKVNFGKSALDPVMEKLGLRP